MSALDDIVNRSQGITAQKARAELDAARTAIEQAREVIEYDQRYLGTKTGRMGKYWLIAHPAPQAEQEQTQPVSAVELAAYRFYLADPGADDILFGLFEDMSADEHERFKSARDKHMERPQ